MSDCLLLGISRLFSLISLISWICAQLPQIYTNYTTKSAEGISPAFLLLWFSGDFLSFLSCFLSDTTLKFQLYLSLFFLCNDITLCYQYYYYISVYSGKYLKENLENEQNYSGNSIVSSCSKTAEVHSSIGALHPRTHSIDPASTSPDPGTFGSTPNGLDKNISMNQVVTSAILNAGAVKAMTDGAVDVASVVSFKQHLSTFLAWGCTLVYVSSRIPQLLKNYERKSVEGMSPLLFSSALSGNLFYTLSILTSCDFLTSPNKHDYFMKQLPYILGSSGTIIFDMVYFYQRRIYKPIDLLRLEMGFENWEG